LELWIYSAGFAGFGAHAQGGDMLKEFKAFAMRGNVLDLAVGFIMGGAFGTIVK
jgi:hypothetical protein